MSEAYERQNVAVSKGETNVFSVPIYLRQGQEISRKGQWFVGTFVSLASSTESFVEQPLFSSINVPGITLAGQERVGTTENIYHRPTMVITPEATHRLHGHEKMINTVYAIAHEEARKQAVHLRKITVRPAWSNEYDERTGVVVDVEIEGTADDRFSYWERVCIRLQELEGSLTQHERDFLVNDLSFIVNRS